LKKEQESEATGARQDGSKRGGRRNRLVEGIKAKKKKKTEKETLLK